MTGVLAHPPFRAALVAAIFERFGTGAMSVLLGFQVYGLTHRPLDLGLLGLVEAIPGVTLVLYGGHFADRNSRKRILLCTTGLMALMALGFALAVHAGAGLPVLLGLAFLNAVIRAFDDPAANGIEAEVVPVEHVLQGVSILATTTRLAGVLGPVAGGFAWGLLGPAATYAGIAGLFVISGVVLLLGVPDGGRAHVAEDEQNTVQRIVEGVRYVFCDQVLLGSMALDLFAVFFGGATALLPVFATDVLHVGAVGFGLLRSASACGSMVAALLAGRLLPQHRAGWVLLSVIGGFGVSMVVFGLSRVLAVSLAALFVAGLCDGTSVVIRRAILRLGSPETMRGRIAAVKSVFVGSSNELGAFESGMVASVIGATAAVWTGGLATLAIVAVTALAAPRLRRLNLVQMARAPAEATG